MLQCTGLATAKNLLHGQLSTFRQRKSFFVVQLFISLAFLLQLDHVTFRAMYKHTQSRQDHSCVQEYVNMLITFL